ncbi:MAG: hypothetical protein L0241_18095 [Planctomycetia bacterium]|nr:hypothetical protein [Planctomycetia bacterium]
MVAVPPVRVGEPLTHDKLTVFPLYLESSPPPGYRLADEALADGTAVVEELTEGGSVPQLAVDNRGESLVLFVEGQELRGAKQNRVLNASILIAAKTKTVLPVSCVEQGRWRYTSRHFNSSDTYSSSKMRSVLKKSVNESTLSGSGHGSNQGAVWAEVTRQATSLGTSSPTMAMSDTVEHHKPLLDRHVAAMTYAEGAAGLAVAVGGKLVSVDLFDSPQTCRKVWSRVVGGVALDAIEEQRTDALSAGDVYVAVESMRAAAWKPVAPAGAGEEERTDTDRWHGSMLTLNGTLVHGSLVCAG